MLKFSVLICLILLGACSSGHFQPEHNRVTVSYKAPKGQCEHLGTDIVETKHWANHESDALSDDVISDLVRSTSAKRANYIHISKVQDTWLKRGLSSSELSKKEMKKTKVESSYYLCTQPK